MTAYYNENDAGAAAWLRQLIFKGHIAPGEVDERSIEDVTPADLAGFTQCHFFAGIGGWSYALRLAGWPDDRPVWTGSCPCQPFSAAGKGKGFADERHLWPAWFWLICQSNPDIIFGEQVASKTGDEWWDLVSSDLEGEGYTSGSIVLGAHSLGAPHIRQRRFWVADPDNTRSQGRSERRNSASQRTAWTGCVVGGDLDFWGEDHLLPCRDGKARPVEPFTFPLAHGVSGRVGLLRGYGNAIVPQVGAAFIRESVST